MRALVTFTAIISGAVLVSACSSPVKLADKAADKPAATAASSASAASATPDPRTVATVTAQSSDPLNDPKNTLAKRSIYFDFDSYSVRQEFNPVIEAHAQYLSARHGQKIILQGNTDERGGSEYNLALGQKRAEAVRKGLSVMGIPESQMEAVSFGKEKPKALGNDESSWEQNRRADIVYAVKQ